ncbi:hypothetical protein [Candidatus Ichthyocystis hellenicum]|uniref:hypothetical protein n=1 Tax=Candidatus Ichthyocystis hellenicum TaxID=1561003 RepID=UPI000B8125C7|nr:hypothetical protein [Candidatus Ichthyocystis hellenicum]
MRPDLTSSSESKVVDVPLGAETEESTSASGEPSTSSVLSPLSGGENPIDDSSSETGGHHPGIPYLLSSFSDEDSEEENTYPYGTSSSETGRRSPSISSLLSSFSDEDSEEENTYPYGTSSSETGRRSPSITSILSLEVPEEYSEEDYDSSGNSETKSSMDMESKSAIVTEGSSTETTKGSGEIPGEDSSSDEPSTSHALPLSSAEVKSDVSGKPKTKRVMAISKSSTLPASFSATSLKSTSGKSKGKSTRPLSKRFSLMLFSGSLSTKHSSSSDEESHTKEKLSSDLSEEQPCTSSSLTSSSDYGTQGKSSGLKKRFSLKLSSNPMFTKQTKGNIPEDERDPSSPSSSTALSTIKEDSDKCDEEEFPYEKVNVKLPLKSRIDSLQHDKLKSTSDLVYVINFLRHDFRSLCTEVLRYTGKRDSKKLEKLCSVFKVSLSKYSDENLQHCISKIEIKLEKIKGLISEIRPAFRHANMEEAIALLAKTNKSISDLERGSHLTLTKLTKHCSELTEAAISCRSLMISWAETTVQSITGVRVMDPNKCEKHIEACTKLITTASTMMYEQAKVYRRELDIAVQNSVKQLEKDLEDEAKSKEAEASTSGCEEAKEDPIARRNAAVKKAMAEKEAELVRETVVADIGIDEPESITQTSCLVKTLAGNACVISSLADWKNNKVIASSGLNTGLNLIRDHSYAEFTVNSISQLINEQKGELKGIVIAENIMLDTSINLGNE